MQSQFRMLGLVRLFRLLSAAAVSFVLLACAQPPSTGGPGGNSGSGGTQGGTGGGTTGTGGVVGGTGGAAVGTGGGSATVMKNPSNYPHNSAGAKFPYPQAHGFARCPLPAYNTDTIATAYSNWKAKFYQTGDCPAGPCGRIIRPEMNGDIVSEGIAYGMLIGVYMNDKSMFDGLWVFAQSKFNGNGLMNWNIGSGGNVIGAGSASDADEDMAWALLMAGAQWGGSYNAAAVTLIASIWNREVEQGSNVLKPGDNFGGSGQTNPSYFAPSYYRAFAKASGNSGWMSVVNSSYVTLGLASGSFGLVPNWSNSQGAGVAAPGASDTNGSYFGYDACRTPWRIALDYCENGEPRAKTYLDKIAGFYAAQAPIGLGTIKDGYTATGTKPPTTLGGNAAGMAFFGPGGVAALPGGHDAFLAMVAQALQSNTTDPGKMNISGVFTYYQASWGVLSLLPLSGNFWNMLP